MGTLIDEDLKFLIDQGVSIDRSTQQTHDTTQNGIAASYWRWSGKDKDGRTNVRCSGLIQPSAQIANNTHHQRAFDPTQPTIERVKSNTRPPLHCSTCKPRVCQCYDAVLFLNVEPGIRHIVGHCAVIGRLCP